MYIVVVVLCLFVCFWVSNGLCEHANTSFFFANTSIDKKVSLASNESFQNVSTCKNKRARAYEHTRAPTEMLRAFRAET